MTEIDCGKSSWLRCMSYTPFAPEWKDRILMSEMANGLGVKHKLHGFLIIESQTGARYAFAVPSFVVGLLAAATSKGRAFGKLVRHKYPSIKLEEEK